LVRVSDARMSGTAFGTVVLHVAPEAAAGGPLRAVRDGDPIVLDVDEQRLDLDVPAEEIARRLAELGPVVLKYRRGYGALYLEHVPRPGRATKGLSPRAASRACAGSSGSFASATSVRRTGGTPRPKCT